MMKTLLVLAAQAGLADAIRAMVDPQRFRVLHCRELWEAEPSLSQSVADAVLIEADLLSVEPIRTVESLHRRQPQLPIFIVAGDKQWEWEEEAYVQGVSHVLSKPVRAALLNLLLERTLGGLAPPAPVPRPAAFRAAPSPEPAARAAHRSPSELLEVLRDFSGILSHSLQAEPLLRQFLLLLREILEVNRAAVFLRQPPGVLAEPGVREASRRLHASCAMGLPPGLLGQFDLSLDTGIGGCLHRSGRVLRRDSAEVEGNLEMQKEFELVGAQVAVPILDRESLIGVALFDGRVTGEPLANGEVGLIFHLLEELGLAIKNIWLHDQVLASSEMMADILRQVQSACLVVGWNLEVLHANAAARACFGRPGSRTSVLEFSHLPQALGSKVFEVLKTGRAVPQFKYALPLPQPRSFRVTITPFHKANQGAPTAALVLVEDCTEEDQRHARETAEANRRLIQVAAERLSHEVGNALVPLSTHQQLFAERKEDRDYLDLLGVALKEGVQRVGRLSSQMLYLARDGPGRLEPFSCGQLLEEAFAEAQRHQPEPGVKLVVEPDDGPALLLSGDRSALKHALCEVFLNAIQAGAKEAKVRVQTRVSSDPRGQKWVEMEIRDAGPGFTPQAAERATDPFFTTRNVGLGLGLTVCRKIIETHQGRLEIGLPGNLQAGAVRLFLPFNYRAEQAAPQPAQATGI
jgi:signal transduction histidine kinase/DNA-binding NarL/FixJ family response regulator